MSLAPLDYPPSAFYFSVNIGTGTSHIDSSFQEVAGMDLTMDLEEYVEGGENRFAHQLPTGVKPQKLSLRRGIAAAQSPLVAWCKRVLEGGLAEPIVPQPVQVSLLDGAGAPLRVWSFTNAYPVHWAIEAFNASKNEVAIEHIELVYQTATRMV